MTQSARGYNTHFCLKRNGSTYGADPGSNYVKIPFQSTTLGQTKGNIADNMAGTGREFQAQFDDLNKIGGDFGGYVDLRNIGFLLTGLLGDSVTTGSSVYTHTWYGSASSLPDYAVEVADKGPAVYRKMLGVMFDGLTMKHVPAGGPAMASFKLIGQSESEAGTTGAGTPTSLTSQRVSNLSGTIMADGAALGDIIGTEFTFNNNLDPAWFVNTTGNLGEITLGQPTVSGKLSTRFASNALLAKARAATRVKLDFSWIIDASNSLAFTIYAAKLAQPSPAISGPDGYGLDFSFDAEYSPADSHSFKCVLVNDQAGSVYA